MAAVRRDAREAAVSARGSSDLSFFETLHYCL
nr:unnamed protein product [Callosobruchus analis]CAI5861943.1 unnamed protein product [Callosobruchus analis]